MIKHLEKIREHTILSIVVLFPVTFAGTFIDQTGLPKLLLIGILIGAALLLSAILFYLTGRFKYAQGKFDLPVIGFLLTYLFASVIVTPNKMEAFFLPGTASFIIGFSILYFLLNTITERSHIKVSLILSAVLLSFTIFGSFLGVFDKIPQLPAFMKAVSFNPAGDFLTSSIYLILSVPFAVFFLIKEKTVGKKLLFSFSLVFILVAAGVSLFNLGTSFKKSQIVFPGFQTSWDVAINTIRENPLLGMGPGNYLTAFDRFRSVSYNQTPLWQLRFSTGNNWYLTVLTESGLVGALVLILLLGTFIKFINKTISIYKESHTITIDIVSISILGAILIFLFVFPPASITLFLVFVLLSLSSSPRFHILSFEGHTRQTPRFIASLLVFAVVLFIGYKSLPLIQAEAKFREANDALQANDGKKTYEDLQQAINLSPWVDRYHASYAQVDLAIARSVATSVKDPKNLTDDQKNTIVQLIQQAIREGQNTVTLNPTRAANWQVLANIYQIIIPYANQADQFAIQSYNQTINYDPIDPNLRITLGGLYFSLQQYDNAINAFQLAVFAKPDLPNAYYNLANAYAAKNDFDNAIAAMNKVLSLLPKNSSDYQVAQTDLDTLQKKQKTFQTTNSNSSLTTPQKQNPVLNPQLNLPEEASPPASVNNGTKSATPTPAASPTATP